MQVCLGVLGKYLCSRLWCGAQAKRNQLTKMTNGGFLIWAMVSKPVDGGVGEGGGGLLLLGCPIRDKERNEEAAKRRSPVCPLKNLHSALIAVTAN